MNTSPKEDFYTKIKNSPSSVRTFFHIIILYFDKDPTTVVHYTFTKGGDLRLAVEQTKRSTGVRLRNFATLQWQTKKQTIFSRMYLSPEELAAIGFHSARIPQRVAESLQSEIWLSESECKVSSGKFISALEQAKMKLLTTL